MRPDLLVLLGPPGSGKSFLGEAIARRLGLDWQEHEALLVGRWGSVEAFAANKSQALAEIEANLRERIARSGRVVVFESTGLSDRPMLERLMAEHPVALVAILAPRDLCRDRVRTRPQGRHLVDDPEGAAMFHDFWTRDVLPTWTVDLAVENDARALDGSGAARTEAILERIAALIAA